MVQDKKVYYDLAYLVSCALNGGNPNLDGIDLVKVKKEAQKESILPLLGKIIPMYKEAYYRNIYRTSNFEKCKKQLYDFLDSQGIIHCSLKGMVIKDYYPQSAMRYMADYDIWLDPQAKIEVRNWLKENNVEVLYYQENHIGEKEDSVLFNKQFHFELHYSLLNNGYCAERWFNYFSNKELFKRLVKVSGSEYRMTNEDFYLFFLIHAYKHSAWVCDMRGLIDCYIINKNLKYDQDYINKKLIEFGLLNYELRMRTISQKVFDGEKLSYDEEKYFLKCVRNETFGDWELCDLRKIAGNGEITKKVRNKAILNLFFMPTDVMKGNYPIVYYSLVLRPVLHMVRIIVKLFNWKKTKIKIEKYRKLVD